MGKLKELLRSRKRDVIVAAVILAVTLASCIPLLIHHFSGTGETGGLMVVTEVGGERVLEVPLNKDARYLLKDGEISQVDASVTLESMGEDALAIRHSLNLIVIENNTVRCQEANCQDQICVNIGTLTSTAYDTPIVCLPHQMVIYIEETE